MPRSANPGCQDDRFPVIDGVTCSAYGLRGLQKTSQGANFQRHDGLRGQHGKSSAWRSAGSVSRCMNLRGRKLHPPLTQAAVTYLPEQMEFVFPPVADIIQAPLFLGPSTMGPAGFARWCWNPGCAALAFVVRIGRAANDQGKA